MKLKHFELDLVNYWNTYVCTTCDTITDVVLINYGSQNLNLEFKFPRFKSLCYYDSFRDYAETYAKSIEFMELKFQLEEQLTYLLNIYSVETIEYHYG
jgi:hypothetical protein